MSVYKIYSVICMYSKWNYYLTPSSLYDDVDIHNGYLAVSIIQTDALITVLMASVTTCGGFAA
jgi:hypothetical protein